MLFLKAGVANLNGGRLEIPAQSALPLIEKMGRNNRIAYFDPVKEAAALVELTGGPGRKGTGFPVSPVKTYRMSAEIIETLFCRHPAFTFEKTFLNRLVRLNDTRELPAIGLYFSWDGDSLGLTYTDPLNLLYERTVFSRRDLAYLADEIIGTLNDINNELRTNPDPDYSRIFEPLHRAASALPLPFTSDISFRKIDAYYEPDAGGNYPFFPLEILFPECFIRNLIPGERRSFLKKNRSFTLVYSQELTYAMKETAELIDYLRASYKLESYPENTFREYQDELAAANYFHYNGHGEIRDGRGCLLFDGRWSDRLPHVKNMRLAVLNCCQTGFTPQGMVENLLASGAHYVIASPFDIPDNTAYSFLKFYRCFSPENPELSYIISSLIDPKLSSFFRLFTNYIRKV